MKSIVAASIIISGSIAPSMAALTTEYLSANGLNFTCTVLDHQSDNPNAPSKDIMMLHGFPMFRVWWQPLLQYWDDLLGDKDEFTVAASKTFGGVVPDISLHAVACDLRGYSPGASPDNIEDYDYSIFAEDTFALAKAAGFNDGFHLLGHDHGAGLAWYVAGNDPDNQVLSLTTMAVPHVDLMSNALCGEDTDEDQVIASNYFNQFSLPDSATTNNASLTAMFASFGLELEPTQFQKMLWWYNGSLAKHFAMPRVVSDSEVEAFAGKFGAEAASFVQGTRAAIPMEERPCIPIEEGNRVGTIEVPSLFICGLNDFALLCNNSYVTDYPEELLPNYEHANYNCGHDFFLEGQCSDMEESQAVMDKITAFVLGDDKTGEDGANSSGGGQTNNSDGTDSDETNEDNSAAGEESESQEYTPASSGPMNILGKLPLLVASGGSVLASFSLCW